MTSLPRSTALLGGAGLFCLASPLALAGDGTVSLPFPMTPVSGATNVLGEQPLQPSGDAFQTLQRLDAVSFTNLVLPTGESVELDLQRIDLERRRFGVHVDGVLDRSLMDGLDLTVWKGTVGGDPDTQVMLGFSPYGSRGWIRTRSGVTHLLPVSHDDGSWFGANAILRTESSLLADGHSFDFDCGTAPPPVAPTPGSIVDPSTSGARQTFDSIRLRECSVAMETDWQFYQLFNDVNAATTYLTTLLSFVSDRYETQTSTVMTFPYLQVYTTSNDPWSTPDNGGNSIDMLNEFRAAWANNVPMNAALGHMMSGASLGGGVAWLNGLCTNDFNFGVSGNIRALANFPIVQQPSNWDFIVVSHEIGHNFDAPHTHDYCPPLDQCAPSGYFGGCQTSQVCTNMGSIMSYCHLCNGGTGNITTFFHPDNAARMSQASAACNPAAFEVQINAPDVVSDSLPTTASIQAVTGSVTTATLFYRFGPGAFQSAAMVSQGGGLFEASIPPAPCGSVVESYFEFDVTGFGVFTAPQSAPTETYESLVGVEVALFSDDFEADTGWVSTNLGASTGTWEREVPVNDANWGNAPMADADGSGRAWVTDNGAGNTDVDGGAVELVSPVFDMSTPGARVQYAYFLRLTNSDGDDRLLVEARSGTGAFAELTRHDVDRGLTWTSIVLDESDFTAAGVTPGAQMQMRFTANDADAQSIVEAGLDAFNVSYLDCGGPGSLYCSPAVANSTGSPARIRAEGSNVAGDNDLTLIAEDLPQNSFGYFLNSETQGMVINAGGSTGTLCLGGSVGRYDASILNSGTAGSYSLTLNLAITPQPNGAVSVMAGQTWNFQCWFRDSILGSLTSNFTDAVSVSFQ